MSHRDEPGRLALVCATQSADRHLVRLPRRIPSLSLKADTKMKTTNLKQTSVAKPRKWFQRRRRWHDPREARPEGSQFRDQKSRGFVEKLSRAQCRGGSSVLGRDMFIVNDCPLSGQAPEERHEQASFSCRSYGARSQPPGCRVYKRVALHGAFL